MARFAFAMANASTTHARAGGHVHPGALIAGKYRVERVLGRGGMGLVVAALHLHLGDRVAVKLLRPGSPLTPAARERFLREGRAAARIRSKHVARVVDAGVLDSDEPYLVLEYLEGIDLRALVRRRGPLPVGAAVQCALQACEGLAHAHALGIVHRDIKPANLFLARERRPDGALGGPLATLKIIDFGVSKTAEPTSFETSAPSLTAYGAAIGTPHYMAPEQMRSARIADARADIWSLGALIHGLLTGSPPFPGETMIEVYDRILRGAPRLTDARTDAPEAIEAIVARCLQLDPAERYQDVRELAAALAEALPPEHRTADLGAMLIDAEPESKEASLDEDPRDRHDPEQPSSGTVSFDVSAPAELLATPRTLARSWAAKSDLRPSFGLAEEPESSPTETATATPRRPQASRATGKIERETPGSPAREGRLTRPLLAIVALALAAGAGAALSRRAPGPLPDAALNGASHLVQAHESPRTEGSASPSPPPDAPARVADASAITPSATSAASMAPTVKDATLGPPSPTRPLVPSGAVAPPTPGKRSPGGGTTRRASPVTPGQEAASPSTPVSAPPPAPTLGLSESPD